MVKNWTKYVLLLLTLITISVRAQYISVNTSYNKDQLVQKLIGANNTCISVSNVSISGYNSAEFLVMDILILTEVILKLTKESF